MGEGAKGKVGGGEEVRVVEGGVWVRLVVGVVEGMMMMRRWRRWRWRGHERRVLGGEHPPRLGVGRRQQRRHRWVCEGKKRWRWTGGCAAQWW